MRQFCLSALVACTLLLSGCSAMMPSGSKQSAVDTLPMYGGMDRSTVPELKAADDQFISSVSKQFGSREHASQLWVGQGYRFYQRDELDMAMKRFNQAWLLNPRNPAVYTGFGAVLHDRRQYCEAMDVMKQALALNPPTFQGIYADAARVVTLCAVNDETLTADARAKLLKESNQLYKKAEAVERDKGYVYASWATAYYWQGQYAEAWQMVAKARSTGKALGKKFLEMLEAKMPAPQS